MKKEIRADLVVRNENTFGFDVTVDVYIQLKVDGNLVENIMLENWQELTEDDIFLHLVGAGYDLAELSDNIAYDPFIDMWFREVD